mmetsp:Transcript_57956/g.129220  ORF Transcript_57956/g.129220 Transcript_57956/m.129220 type:complete len:85 (+) Transcript_57956:622-876(+)
MVLFGQREQISKPASAPYLPGVHPTHSAFEPPSAGPLEPRGQAVQLSAPGRSENLPSAQLVQFADPAVSCAVEAGQGVQPQLPS